MIIWILSVLWIDEIITEYLIGCLSKDAFLNLEKEVKFLNCNNVIDAARYMIMN